MIDHRLDDSLIDVFLKLEEQSLLIKKSMISICQYRSIVIEGELTGRYVDV